MSAALTFFSTHVPIPPSPSTCLRPDEPAAFSTLAVLARLGHKYALGRIYTAAIKRLKSVFTDDFQAWRAHEGRTTLLVKFIRNGRQPIPHMQRSAHAPRRAIHVLLSQHTHAPARRTAQGRDHREARARRPRALPRRAAEDEARSTAFNHRMLDSSDPARPGCVARHPPTCSARLPQLLRGLGDALGALGGDAGASTRQQCLRVFVETHRSPEMRETLGLCRVCAEYVLSSNLRFFEELWRDLPNVLDLPVPGWP